jgi:hypothetical protein
LSQGLAGCPVRGCSHLDCSLVARTKHEPCQLVRKPNIELKPLLFR